MNNQDLEKVSDDEINARVMCVIDPFCNKMEFNHETMHFSFCRPDGEGGESFKADDFCNDINYAWPIILNNGISVIPDPYNKNSGLFLAHSSLYEGSIDNAVQSRLNKNPLRAAMEVFLINNCNKE